MGGNKKEHIIKQAQKLEFYPVSPAQKRMYILDKMERSNTAYNLPIAIEFRRKIDMKQLQNAVNKLIQRHEVLRTCFKFIEGVPVQFIVSKLELKIEKYEINSNEYDDITTKFISPFDLKKAPLFRCALLKVDKKNDIILIDIHHIISDATSISILIKELYQLYMGIKLTDLPIQYKDFAQWQLKAVNSGRYKEQEKFWLDIYKNGEIPVLNMPLDFNRTTIQNFEGDKIYTILENKEYVKLKSEVSNFQSTIFIVIVTALNIALSKYAGQNDIIIGTMITGRSYKELQGLIGLLVNTLPIRTTIDDYETFLELHNRVKEHILNIYKNQDYQFEELISKLELKKDMSRNPLFDIMFILQDSNLVSKKEAISEIKLLEIKRNISKFDITIDAIEFDGHIEFTFEYCSSIYKKSTIQQLSKHFIFIIKQILENPNIQIKDIDLLTEHEKRDILSINPNNYFKTELMTDMLIYNQVKKNPEKIALVCGKRKMTYREVDLYSNIIANRLIEKQVKKGAIIGILMESCNEMIIGMLGIWKVGAAYLPLDHFLPEDRIEYMIKDSKTSLIITQKKLKEKYKFLIPCMEIEEINTEEINLEQSTYNTNILLKGNDLAYVIYTSGTTGNPKGVMIEHGSLSNFVHSMLEIIPFSKNKSILCVTTMSFDIFVFETWVSLSNGMSIVIAKEEEKKSPKKLYNLVYSELIDMIQTTSSRLQMILNDNKNKYFLKDIKVICVGGEVFTENLLIELKKITKAKIFNMYGPTETTVWSTVKDLTHNSKITIGKPIRNTDVYILDENRHLQPRQVVGELFIGGNGLARGYWNQHELTREKFMNNPFRIGEKMYATGDLARINHYGELEIIGRKDNQVKVRGYRIELEEIENAIIKYTCIKETAVIVKEDNQGYSSIYAYFATNMDILIQDLRKFLRNVLPDYMIPSYFIRVDSLPYTSNGKLNRKELLNFNETVITKNFFEPPKCKEEEQLLNIWKEVLKVSELGINDDFFDFGGNSLLLIKLIVKLEEMNFKVDTTDIVHCKTVHNLYELLFLEKDKNKLVNNNTTKDDNLSQSHCIYDNQIVTNINSKTIDNIEPFNSLFYKNCFYNSLFPILKYYGIDILSILVNDVVVYKYKENDCIVSVVYEEVLNNSSILSNVGLHLIEIKKNNTKNIIENLKESLNNEKPIILGVDCYYLSIREDTYMKEHWPHTILIYGYDDNSNYFNIIEHSSRDSLTYAKRVLSYYETKKSYLSLKKRYPKFLEEIDFYQFEYEQVEAITSLNNIFKSNFIAKKTKIKFGIEQLKMFCQIGAEFFNSQKLLDSNIDEIITSLNNIINAKTSQTYLIENLYEESDTSLLLIKQVLKLWTDIRIIILKYKFSGIYNKSNMYLIEEMLFSIYEKEEKYYDVLEKKFLE